MILALTTSIVAAAGSTVAIARPPGEIPADAYQEPESTGDDSYWSKRAEGYFQEPEP